MNFYIGYILTQSESAISEIGINPYCVSEGLADKSDEYSVDPYIAGRCRLCPEENKKWYEVNNPNRIEFEGEVGFNEVGDRTIEGKLIESYFLPFLEERVKVTIERL